MKFQLTPFCGLALLLIPLAVLFADDKFQDDKTVPPKVEVKILRSDKLTQPLNGRPAKSSLIEITIAPGAGSPPHRHPGPVVGYVLEGTYEFQVDDQPLRTLKPGDTFFEPTMALHRVSRNPDDKTRTRILVTMIHPADAKNLVLPADAPTPKTKSK